MTAPSGPTLLTNQIDPSVFSVIFAPNVTGTELSETERLVMGNLAAKLLDGRYQTELNIAGMYYLGTNIVPSLGISVPPELEQLRAILGWCAAGVDARSERLNVLGFRMPGQTEVDDKLQETWQANNLDAEAPLVHDTAMIYGRAFVVVGKADEDGAPPLITTESPHNMIGSWDVRKRELSAAYQTYFDVDPASETYLSQLATLYTRQATIQLVKDRKSGQWVVQERNDHGQGFVPVRMFAHLPTIRNRMGCSVMTNAWRNTQDRACRTLVRMEIASEFHAVKKILLLGATEKAFQDAEGNLMTAWETYIGRISGLEADENGNLPQVHEVSGESPAGFISALDHERSIMAGHTGLAPQFLGIFSDGNPASADAIRMSDFRIKTTADRLTVSLGNDWEAVMRMSQKVDGTYTDASRRMETDWAYTGIPTPNADAITIATQIQAGQIAPDDDDALAANGWSPVQRERIRANLKRFRGTAVINQAIRGLGQPAAQPSGQQPADGQQPGALAALNTSRTTDGASAG